VACCSVAGGVVVTSGSPTPTTDTSGLEDPRQGSDTGEDAADAQRAAETLVGIITARDYPQSHSTPIDVHAAAMAERILGAGFRRVPEDAATVERLRRALWARSWRHAPKMATEENWQWARKQLDWDGQPAYDGVVRALLAELAGVSVSGGGEQP
jgi:hypothetical protein